MALDDKAQEYIENLKLLYYSHGAVQKDGTAILKEMITLVKSLISYRNKQVSRKLVFIDKRAVRISKILETLGAIVDNTGLKAKNAVFHSNAQTLMGTSDAMDAHVANISLEVRNVIRKIRSYERQYDEIIKKKIEYEAVIDYYETAKEDLEELDSALE